jgi:hypothetical protein
MNVPDTEGAHVFIWACRNRGAHMSGNTPVILQSDPIACRLQGMCFIDQSLPACP